VSAGAGCLFSSTGKSPAFRAQRSTPTSTFTHRPRGILENLLQTSEAIRAYGHPDWFVLAGFLHDPGKVLCLFREPL